MAMELVIAVLIGIPLVYVGLDVWLALDDVPGNTYSEIIRKVTRDRAPLLVLAGVAAGMVFGHLWW